MQSLNKESPSQENEDHDDDLDALDRRSSSNGDSVDDDSDTLTDVLS